MWFWHPLLMLSLRGGVDRPDRVRGAINPRSDGDKKELVAGKSTKDPVKTIAQGRPDDPAPPVVTTVCFLPMHTGRGCALSTRSSLRPLILEGGPHSSSGAICAARMRMRVLTMPSPHLPLSSSAKADDPVFQRRQGSSREATAYWIARSSIRPGDMGNTVRRHG